MRGRIRQGLYSFAVLAALFAGAYLSASILGWGCPVQHFTGVPCPGCGLSRALFALLRLDFAAAFRYHPMIYVLPPVALYTLFGKKPLLGSKTCERVLLWGTMALWAAVWLARLILHDPLVWGT